MSFENIKVSLKNAWFIIALVLGQVVTFSMTAGEYKAKIDTIEAKVEAQRVETRELRKEMENLRFAISELRITIQQDGLKK